MVVPLIHSMSTSFKCITLLPHLIPPSTFVLGRVCDRNVGHICEPGRHRRRAWSFGGVQFAQESEELHVNPEALQVLVTEGCCTSAESVSQARYHAK